MYYYKAGKTLYITDEIHLHGATNDIIARELKPIVGSDILICDSAEPKSIQELRNLTLNAVGAQKGKDSVAWGIQWLQQQNIIIDISCQYTKNEFEQYHWQKNKDGENMRVPVDRDNHHIDNIRYAVEDITLQTGLGLYNFAEEQYKRFQEENKQVFVQSSIAQQEVEYLTLNQ
jgi:phage terminase large subunit